MQVEVMLERQVVCVALVVLTAMILEIRSLGQPSLQVLTLQVGRISIGTLEGHLVYLLIGGDVDKVVAGTAITVDVAAIHQGVR